MESSRRTLWTVAETSALIAVIREKRIMSLFDGKLYKSREIFNLILDELRARGFTTTDSKNIEMMWHNLKALYYAAKKENDKNGNGRAIFEFYEEMDAILGERPTVRMSTSGIDMLDSFVIRDNELEPGPSNRPVAGPSDPPVSNHRPADNTTARNQDNNKRGCYLKANNAFWLRLEQNQERHRQITAQQHAERNQTLISVLRDLNAQHEANLERILDRQTKNFVSAIGVVRNSKKCDKQTQIDNSNTLTNYFQDFDTEEI